MMIAGRWLPPWAALPLRGDDGRRDGAGRPGLGDAYRWCRRTVRERDPAIYALTALMPRMLWPGCWALWAALAAVDDIVDSRTTHPAERAVELQAWMSALDTELATGTSTDMVRRALVDTIVRWGLDVADLRASFLVLADDVHPAPLVTWDDWRARARGTDSAWARQILVLLDRAGVDMSFALRHGEAIGRARQPRRGRGEHESLTGGRAKTVRGKPLKKKIRPRIPARINSSVRPRPGEVRRSRGARGAEIRWLVGC